MRKSIFLPCLSAMLLSFAVLHAANPRLLKFETPTLQLGSVDAADGKIVVKFLYTNIADTPVSIATVHAQCGCTVPKYSQQPVEPGKEGVVSVVFDPRTLAGEVSHGLTVIASNGEYRKYSTLVIKADVTPVAGVAAVNGAAVEQ